MPMVQGIDGMMLINALRAGKQDRMTDDAWEIDKAQKEAALESEKTRKGLLGRITGQGGPQGGVAGQFNAPAGGIDQNAMREYIVFDPENGKKMVEAFKSMDEGTLSRARAKNDIMGAAARFLRQNAQSPQERQQLAQVLIPQLIQAGWTEQELAGVDLTDRGLSAYEAVAIDYDKMIDNAMAEREFNRPRIVTPQPGEGAFTLDNEGNVTPLVMPNPGDKPFGGPAASPSNPPPPPTRTAGDAFTFADFQSLVKQLGPEGAVRSINLSGTPVRVDTPDQARQLPSGTKILLPDGREGTVP